MAEPNQETVEQEEGGKEAPSFLDSLYPSGEQEASEEPEENEESSEQEEGAGDTTADADEAQASEEEDVVTSLSDLLEQQEWDEEWFQSLKVPVKVDGKSAEATLKDLVDSYQIQEAAEHRLNEAKSKAQATNQELAQQREQAKTELGTAAALVQIAEQLFTQDKANLDKLKEEDPDRYLIEKDAFSEKMNALSQVKHHVRQNLQQALNQQPDPKVFETERQALIQKAPSLDSEDARSQLADYLLKQEFTEQELSSVPDHRLFVLAHKAMLYDQSQAKTETAKKKVAKIPRVMKPGPKKSAEPEKPKDAASILYG